MLTVKNASKFKHSIDSFWFLQQINSFLFGGIDTTSSALTWLLYLLATHPEHQKKVQGEMDELLQDRESPDVCR